MKLLSSIYLLFVFGSFHCRKVVSDDIIDLYQIGFLTSKLISRKMSIPIRRQVSHTL